MRQLKGKPTKESKRDKRERRRDNLRGQQLGLKFAVPALFVAFVVLAVLIYNATH